MGKDGKDFKLYKFRSMRVGADAKGLITVGGRDPRITKGDSTGPINTVQVTVDPATGKILR